VVDLGTACAKYHDEHVRGVTSKRIEVDEIWAFIHCKQRNVALAKAAPVDAGDMWTWTAIDAQSKLMVSWLVGGRDGGYAMAFIDDLRSRLANRVQLTSDGHKAYLEAVEGAFGGDVDFAQLVKLFGASPDSSKGRYSPAMHRRSQDADRNPDMKHVSTSYAERQNLTMRMSMRRFARLTNGFSKKAENHAHHIAIFFLYYNFARIHQSLRMTPAMAVGLTARLWEIEDIVRLLD
jgi:IS1 family transposase